MNSLKKNLLCSAIVLVACGLLAFSLFSESILATSYKLSDRQMANIRGTLDCEDDDGKCEPISVFVYNANVCKSAKEAVIRAQNDDETQEEYQEYLANTLPKCRRRTDYYEQIEPTPSNPFKTKKGADTEFHKKYKCGQYLYCTEPGVAAPNREKKIIHGSVFEYPSEECGLPDPPNPKSYCIKCFTKIWEFAPDSEQPDILKCKAVE